MNGGGENLNKTVYEPYSSNEAVAHDFSRDDWLLLVTSEGQERARFSIHDFATGAVTVGAAQDNRIIVPSRYVSRQHGYFQMQSGALFYVDMASRNGTRIGDTILKSPGAQPVARRLGMGDVLIFDHLNQAAAGGTQVFVTFKQEQIGVRQFDLRGKSVVKIGRDSLCDIQVPHVSVSRVHAMIRLDPSGAIIADNHSTNGVSVNGKRVQGRAVLCPHDVIRVGTVRIVFQGELLLVMMPQTAGISVSVRDVTKRVWQGGSGILGGLQKKRRNILDHVSLDIQPGEMVAIIGGSGAGKTTLMNAMSGFCSISGGHVLIDGEDFHQNYAVLKQLIGYVPQQDIVYDKLTLESMLGYAAEMRMPKDTTPQERAARISQVLEAVDMQVHRTKLISKLSGGQKKRASIAVELIADPQLFFLDEPTSGLDPGTEELLLHKLRELSRQGKTIILVTHSTLYLDMFDKVIVMGNGGKLCFMDHASKINGWFGVAKLPGIYVKINSESDRWQQQYNSVHGFRADQPVAERDARHKDAGGIPFMRQLSILIRRYAEIMMRSGGQMMLLALQAVFFAAVLVGVAGEDVYAKFGATQTVCFVMACFGMWMGLFLAVSEITKERAILRREYMANLKLPAYVLSKFIVLGIIAIVQTVLLYSVMLMFTQIADKAMPDRSILFPPIMENMISIALVSLSSVGMGLFVSAFFKQPDRVTPYILMPQIVLSGVLFSLGDALDKVTYLVVTYWGNNALCSSADVNELAWLEAVDRAGASHAHDYYEVVDKYASTAKNLLGSWGALLLITVILLAGCAFSLRKLKSEER